MNEGETSAIDQTRLFPPDLPVTDGNPLCYSLKHRTHETYDAHEADGTDDADGPP